MSQRMCWWTDLSSNQSQSRKKKTVPLLLIRGLWKERDSNVKVLLWRSQVNSTNQPSTVISPSRPSQRHNPMQRFLTLKEAAAKRITHRQVCSKRRRRRLWCCTTIQSIRVLRESTSQDWKQMTTKVIPREASESAKAVCKTCETSRP